MRSLSQGVYQEPVGVDHGCPFHDSVILSFFQPWTLDLWTLLYLFFTRQKKRKIFVLPRTDRHAGTGAGRGVWESEWVLFSWE